MKLSLHSYFDLGASYGLGDDIFHQLPSVVVSDIRRIGIRNPLGQGIICRLHNHNPTVLHEWRAAAARKVDIPEMELGFPESRSSTDNGGAEEFAGFKERLKEYIYNHPIESCELTIYAIGIVFLRLDFASGLPLEFLQGFAHCFEFAAYEESTSNSLLQVARQTLHSAIQEQDSGIQKLSKRAQPAIQRDDRGYKESELFSSFTHLALCVDEGDDVEAVKQKLLPAVPGSRQPTYEELSFEYHGVLYFESSASCVLVPRSYDHPSEPPSIQLQRMLYCIQIAHTFLGICEAFERLFFDERLRQAGGYVKGTPGGRDQGVEPLAYFSTSRRQLNQLRASRSCR